MDSPGLGESGQHGAEGAAGPSPLLAPGRSHLSPSPGRSTEPPCEGPRGRRRRPAQPCRVHMRGARQGSEEASAAAPVALGLPGPCRPSPRHRASPALLASCGYQRLGRPQNPPRWASGACLPRGLLLVGEEVGVTGPRLALAGKVGAAASGLPALPPLRGPGAGCLVTQEFGLTIIHTCLSGTRHGPAAGVRP